MYGLQSRLNQAALLYRNSAISTSDVDMASSPRDNCSGPGRFGLISIRKTISEGVLRVDISPKRPGY